jgi:protein SCO1/2
MSGRRTPFRVAGALFAALCLALLPACDTSGVRARPGTALFAEPTAVELRSSQGSLPLADLRDKVIVLSFGYTHCPDVCPANLAAGAQALTRLTPAERAQVRLVMVAVDPARDTPESLSQYLAFFHPDMRGLRAEPAALARIAHAFQAIYIARAPGAAGEYAVDHSAQSWLLDRQGGVVRVLDFGTPPEAIVAAIRQTL